MTNKYRAMPAEGDEPIATTELADDYAANKWGSTLNPAPQRIERQDGEHWYAVEAYKGTSTAENQN